MSARNRSDVRVERFENLYRTTRTEILAYLVRRTARAEDAADVLGEVYATAWRRIDDLPGGDDARLWLYGTARRTLANHRRRNDAVRGIADRLRDELRAGGIATEPDRTDAISVAVRAALDAMDPDSRELLTLTAWEGLTPGQIATSLDEPAGTVRVRLHRARAEFRRRLSHLQLAADRT